MVTKLEYTTFFRFRFSFCRGIRFSRLSFHYFYSTPSSSPLSLLLLPPLIPLIIIMRGISFPPTVSACVISSCEENEEQEEVEIIDNILR